jgi:hypothetical protein
VTVGTAHSARAIEDGENLRVPSRRVPEQPATLRDAEDRRLEGQDPLELDEVTAEIRQIQAELRKGREASAQTDP